MNILQYNIWIYFNLITTVPCSIQLSLFVFPDKYWRWDTQRLSKTWWCPDLFKCRSYLLVKFTQWSVYTTISMASPNHDFSTSMVCCLVCTWTWSEPSLASLFKASPYFCVLHLSFLLVAILRFFFHGDFSARNNILESWPFSSCPSVQQGQL